MTLNPENWRDSLLNIFSFSPRDWAKTSENAWTYGIVCGWDDECLEELSCEFGWTPECVARLKRLRAGFVAEPERLARLERRAKDWAKQQVDQERFNYCQCCRLRMLKGDTHAHDCDAAIILGLERESVR